MKFATLLLAGLAVASAVPERVLGKYEVGPRYQHVAAPDGVRLEDLWLKTSDVAAAARFDPNVDIGYHLFTRANPNVSQPIVLGFPTILQATNYDANKKTIVLLHGWLNTPSSDFNVHTVNAEAVARFITWLNQASGSSLAQYHLVGHSLGGQQVGIIGRNLGGQVPYITSLDPAWPGWITNPQTFKSDDGIYTEAMHTDAGLSGYLTPVADVDFYPNGGREMPNCEDRSCDHHQCIFYFAESVMQGGFTGVQCSSYLDAMSGTCTGPGTLKMGGTEAKTGRSGVYYVETFANPPYSKG